MWGLVRVFICGEGEGGLGTVDVRKLGFQLCPLVSSDDGAAEQEGNVFVQVHELFDPMAHFR